MVRNVSFFEWNMSPHLETPNEKMIAINTFLIHS